MAREVPDDLARRLRLARTKRRLTQTALAELAEMNQSDISKIERREAHSTTGIARLASALRVPARWLERGEGPEPDWDATALVERIVWPFSNELFAQVHKLYGSDDLLYVENMLRAHFKMPPITGQLGEIGDNQPSHRPRKRA